MGSRPVAVTSLRSPTWQDQWFRTFLALSSTNGRAKGQRGKTTRARTRNNIGGSVASVANRSGGSRCSPGLPSVVRNKKSSTEGCLNWYTWLQSEWFVLIGCMTKHAESFIM